MASSSSKFSRKRSQDEIDRDLSISPPSDHSGHGKRDWRVKTFDEILVEKQKRRKLESDSPILDEESSLSRISSVASSPGVLAVDDSIRSSKNLTPTQEVIYQLSPEHNSPLSVSSETTKHKSRAQLKKGRRKTEEEEGEIFSDISDGEPGSSKAKSRTSSRHVSVDVEMTETITEEDEPSTQSKDGNSEEISQDSEHSSEEEDEKATEQPEKSDEEEQESSEEESSDSSEESDSSEAEEEEEKTEEKNTAVQDKKTQDNKEPESSEDDSEEDSDDSDSEESDDSDTSEEEEEKIKKETTAAIDTKKTTKHDDVDVKTKKPEKASSTSRPEVSEKPKEKDRHSKESASRHQKTERTREKEKPSRREREDRDVRSREKRENKATREDSERTSRKHKSSNENTDYKKSKESKRTEKDRLEKSRDRPDKQDKVEYKKKSKDSKSSTSNKESKLTNKDKESKSSSKQDSKSSTKQSTTSKLLTDEERMQFVAYDSEDAKSDDDVSHDSDRDDVNVTEVKEEEEKTKPDLPDYLPAIQGCRNVSEEFVWLNRIEEGTYGVVYRARDKRSDEIVALKGLKMAKEKEGFPITSLREINTLLKGQHPNIVTVREVVVGGNMDKIFIVMDYVEHDLKTLMEHMSSKFSIGEVKTLLVQLLRAVAHLHDNWILHRDLKTSNLLLSNKGILKVADFGLAREYGSPLKPYTPIVVTLWYRAPELLLGIKEYSCPIDMWSVGCIFAELLTMKPLFPGKSEIDQINKIFKDLGTPSDKIWPGPPSYSELPHVKKMTFTEYPYNQLRNKFGTYLTDKGFDLLNKFLTYDPRKRITADEALKHDYFNESPYPVKPDMFPTWPAKSEMMKRPKKRDYEHSPKPPEGGEMFAKLKEGGDSSGSASGAQGFHMLSSKKGSAAVAGFSLKF